MKIDLIRHGEIEAKNTYCGVTDSPLTKFGWEQMISVCDNADLPWELIISSPLIRCRKFAEYLSEKSNIPLKLDERWQEMNFGDWDGMTSLEIMDFDKVNLQNFWNNPFDYPPPNGEPLKIVQKRVLDAWQDAIALKKRVLIIAHGGPIRIIHCYMKSHPIELLMNINVEYASINSYRVDTK